MWLPCYILHINMNVSDNISIVKKKIVGNVPVPEGSCRLMSELTFLRRCD